MYKANAYLLASQDLSKLSKCIVLWWNILKGTENPKKGDNIDYYHKEAWFCQLGYMVDNAHELNEPTESTNLPQMNLFHSFDFLT